MEVDNHHELVLFFNNNIDTINKVSVRIKINNNINHDIKVNIMSDANIDIYNK